MHLVRLKNFFVLFVLGLPIPLFLSLSSPASPSPSFLFSNFFPPPPPPHPPPLLLSSLFFLIFIPLYKRASPSQLILFNGPSNMWHCIKKLKQLVLDNGFKSILLHIIYHILCDPLLHSLITHSQMGKIVNIICMDLLQCLYKGQHTVSEHKVSSSIIMNMNLLPLYPFACPTCYTQLNISLWDTILKHL